MKYAKIRSMDISNGEGIGVSLFVQGCPHPHCKNCFNPETWDFCGGKEWTNDVEKQFMMLINKPYINHISILGGEPLCEQNLEDVTSIVQRCKMMYPNKKIWIWSKYNFEQYICKLEIVKYIDRVIDGNYIDELKDISLLFRGSSNQHVWRKITNEQNQEEWYREM